MLMPKVLKVVINMGVAEALKDKNIIQDCAKELNDDFRTEANYDESKKVDLQF